MILSMNTLASRRAASPGVVAAAALAAPAAASAASAGLPGAGAPRGGVLALAVVVLHVVLDLVALREVRGAVFSVHLPVHEHILTTIVRRDEAESFVIEKLLDSPCRHG